MVDIELEAIELNGTRQWIGLAGRERKAPVLLFLHGGPGMPEIAAMRRHFPPVLQERFTIVGWDQRGAGKSFRAAAGVHLSLDLMLGDLLALVDLLRARFAQERIFIVGHSWGSILGALFASSHHERVAAYVGIGQVVNGIENEQESYRWALEQARSRGKAAAIRGLEAIASYGEDPLAGDWLRNLRAERKWLSAMGGGTGHDPAFNGRFIRGMLMYSGYSLADKVNCVRGGFGSIRQLWPEIMALDLLKTAPRIDAPVALFSGRYDYNTPLPLAEAYLAALAAPRKELVVFEESAHSPCYEEPERFAAELVRFCLEG